VGDAATAYLGRGPAFPVAVSDGALPLHAGEEKIQESIWLILATAPGERVMRPDFGCGIHDLLFAANTAQTRALAVQRVKDALTRWEPRIDVLSVDATVPDDPGSGLVDQRNVLMITINYRIRANNAVFNLVYPFYLTEGAGG
jgi:phage baseplate assembly protein W